MAWARDEWCDMSKQDRWDGGNVIISHFSAVHRTRKAWLHGLACTGLPATDMLVRCRPPPTRPLRASTSAPPQPAPTSTPLVALENEAFRTDRLSRRSFRRLISSPRGAVIVAELHGKLAGYALVLFRAGSAIARLYSIAVAAHAGGRRIGARAARRRREGGDANRGASVCGSRSRKPTRRRSRCYRKSGYREFGRHHEYYEDKSHALRFEKRLTPDLPGLKNAPPYFHQTTEFTCGPACMMMALAWADPRLRPSPALEFRLWREATTICMTSGPGGCEPLRPRRDAQATWSGARKSM